MLLRPLPLVHTGSFVLPPWDLVVFCTQNARFRPGSVCRMARCRVLFAASLVLLAGCGGSGGDASSGDSGGDPTKRISAAQGDLAAAGYELDCYEPDSADAAEDPAPVERSICTTVGPDVYSVSFYVYASNSDANRASDGIADCDFGGAQVIGADGEPQQITPVWITDGPMLVVAEPAIADAVNSALGGTLHDETC